MFYLFLSISLRLDLMRHVMILWHNVEQLQNVGEPAFVHTKTQNREFCAQQSRHVLLTCQKTTFINFDLQYKKEKQYMDV